MATSRENKTISQFKTALIGGGARPNLFEVELTTLPDQVEGWDADNFRFLCKARQLPCLLLILHQSMFLLEVVFSRLLETERSIPGL